MQSVIDDLKALADPSYQAFQAKLVPNIDATRILGVRTPALRRYAKSFATDARCSAFITEELPHQTYEEMNLHGELIGLLSKTPEEAFDLLDPFLPYIDNWATCDLIKVRAFKKNLPLVYQHIQQWTAAHGPHSEYMVRFGVVQLMEHFLDDAFAPEQLDLIVGIKRPEYYINMARAWYLSFAIIKQPKATLPLFIERKPDGSSILDPWTHNKALQKARESRRVSADEKVYFQSLKV